MKYSGTAVIEAIRKGTDRDLLNFLYKSILPRVTRYIVKNNGSREDAFDIFQDAVVAFHRFVKEKKFHEDGNPETFIFCICRNLWINRVKKEKKQVRMPADYERYEDDAQSALEGIITEERACTIRTMLSKLGKKCEELLKLSIYDNMSLKEICLHMGFTSEDAVKTQKYKCKQKLISYIKEHSSLDERIKLN
ncbi:MAG: sigma-70 family RNA polymerase sigma factor [Bacteroidales bacterium]|nr:sigma-70 family RNA polymerase sigma factor [Bacteroidales bacterium]